MDLSNTAILVTGAGSGIGRAIALRAAQDGPSVVVCVDKNSQGATLTAEEITAKGVPSYAIVVDLSNQGGIEMLAEAVLEKHGAIDVLFSNAGVSFGGGLDTDEQAWSTSWEVNLMAQVRLARLLLPAMIAKGGGYIVNTASAAGLLTNLGALSYAVTKHASVALSEWIAITHKKDNIRVSVLCPMGVRTNMLFPASPEVEPADRLAQAAVLQAGELLEPDEVANIVMRAVNAEEFLILPHEEVRKFYSFRANDTAKWISSMAKYQERLTAK